MSELITEEIFTDGQVNINAANMNGIIGRASVQPDIIAAKPASVTMDVSDQMLILKTDNTLAKARFDTIVNSTSSTLPVADTTKNGMLRQVSGATTDYVDGTNNCRSLTAITTALLPAGVVCDYAGPNLPSGGWLPCFGQSLLRSSYPELFTAIGGTYGAVDGNHFSLPNCQDRFTVCAGGSYVIGAMGGAASVALEVGNLPSHTHAMANHTHAGADHLHGLLGHSHTYGLVTFQAGGYQLQQWSGTGGKVEISSNTNSTGGPNVGTTDSADRSLTTGGPNINSTQPTGSGTAFSIIPVYAAFYKIIKT